MLLQLNSKALLKDSATEHQTVQYAFLKSSRDNEDQPYKLNIIDTIVGFTLHTKSVLA